MPALMRILGLGILFAALCGASPDPIEELGDREFKSELQQLERETKKFDDLRAKLVRSGSKSANSERARAVDNMQQHMIEIVLRREDAFGLEHTIIRHGAPAGPPTAAAEAGTPRATKNSRRQFKKGLGNYEPAFQRLARMQQLIVTGERIYQQAIDKQSGAFETYEATVEEFGKILQTESNIFANEAQRRSEEAAAKAAADSVAAGY